MVITWRGSTPGAREGNFDRRKLLKTDWPAAREVDVPTQKETG